jgi:hypothetical protein
MGSDFLERTKKTIKRSWDRQRVALGTSDLLTRPPDCAGRSVGEIIGYARLHPGEKLTVEPNGLALVARRGLDEVVRITTAAADVVKGVKDSCGVACVTRTRDPIITNAQIALSRQWPGFHSCTLECASGRGRAQIWDLYGSGPP